MGTVSQAHVATCKNCPCPFSEEAAARKALLEGCIIVEGVRMVASELSHESVLLRPLQNAVVIDRKAACGVPGRLRSHLLPVPSSYNYLKQPG